MTPINRLPDPPQTGYRPPTITAEQQKRLLSLRRDADRTDLFVNDPDEAIHTLGRLALRRGGLLAADYFALGDLCARQSLRGQQLLILYVGKVFAAYRRAESAAGSESDSGTDKQSARDAIAAYAQWVLTIAEQIPTAHNIAVALWTLAEWQPDISPVPYQAALNALRNQEAKGVSAIGTEADYPATVLPTPDPVQNSYPATNVEWSAESLPEIPADEQPTIAPDIPLDPVVAPIPSGTSHTHEYRKGERIGPKDDLERYEITNMWRGGMGIVYAAYDRVERYPVALKTIQTRLDRRAERDLYDRFVHEARTWIKLEKHPHVVQALIVQTIADRPYLALEYVGGPEGLGSDLSRWIEHCRIDLAQALEIALHICRGMNHAVTRMPNLVHRDLKPANILVTTDGVAKVTDFGLAYAVQPLDFAAIAQTADASGRMTHAGMVPGTPQYLSPEQCRAEPLDSRSDVYAVGIILFEMLTNRPLYSARTPSEWLTAHQTGIARFPDDSATVPLIPAAVRDLVLRCLSRSREDRPETWDSLAAELAGLYESVTGQAAAASAEGESLAARELMDIGYGLGEIGRYDEALDAYNRALLIDPESAWGWARKGRALRILRRYEEALQCFNQALALNPRYAWAANQRGIVLAQQGDRIQAVQSYQEAARLRPNDPWPLYNQAELLEKEGRFDDALTLLDQALVIDPAHGQSHAKRGDVLRAVKRYDAALTAYDEALRYAPGDGRVWYGKGVVLYCLNRLDEAVNVLGHATRSHSKAVSMWAWYRLAETLTRLKRFEEALGAIQQAVRLQPDYATGWSRQGDILMRLRRYEEALDAFNRVVGLAPDNGDGKIDQAKALIKLKRPADSLEVVDQALEQSADQPLRTSQTARLWSVRAQALRGLGRYKEAVTAYDHALQLRPNAHWDWHDRGQALAMMDRLNEAIDSYDRAATLASQIGWYREHQIELLLKSGDIDDALDVAEQATRELPTSARAWAKLGQILRQLDRHTDALTAYDQAVTRDPDYGWAWTGKGLALAALDRWDEAVICHERASRLPHADVWAWYHYGQSLVASKRYADAIWALDKGLLINPSHKLSQALRLEAIHLGNG